jgi:cell division septum initiation protein DivIVA
MPAVDTLQAYETLRLQGGLDEKVAKAIVTACTNLLSPSFAELATKADLEQYRTAIKAELEQLRTEMRAALEQFRAETRVDLEQHRMATTAELEQLRGALEQHRMATKAEVDQLRATTKGELAETKAELIKWMVGLLVAQTVALMGLFKLVL